MRFKRGRDDFLLKTVDSLVEVENNVVPSMMTIAPHSPLGRLVRASVARAT